MANPKIEVEIGAKIAELTKGLTDAESKLQSFGRKAVSIGKTLSLAVTAPILALGAAAIKSASDTEESFSKFGTIFRDVSKSAENSFKTLRNEYGLSSLEAKTLLGNTGDLLTGFGFTQKAALDLATDVNKLAVDLASFTNFAGGAKGASDALTKALLGERESVKALGISILEEDVKKKVLINTTKGLTFESERQAKAFATLQIAQEQSQNAIGDYARTSDSFANQTRLLTSRISDLTAEFGQILLPVATKITSVVTRLIDGFTGLDEQTRKTIVIISGIAAAIGPLSLAIGATIQALPLLAAGFAALTGPIGIVSAAIIGLTTLIVFNFDEIKQSLKLLALEFIQTAQTIIKFIKPFADAFPSLTGISSAALIILQNKGEEVAASFIKNLGTDSKKSVEELTDSITTLSGSSFENLIGQTEKLKRTFEDTAKISQSLTFAKLDRVDVLTRNFEAPLDNLSSGSAETQGINTDNIQSEIKALDALKESLSGTGISVEQFYKAIANGAAEGFSSLEEFIGALAKTQEFIENVFGILEVGLENTIGDIAFSIGDALASGANALNAGGAALLGGLASILNQLGQLAIGTGIAIGGIKKALQTLNPAVAIAAGVALVGLAGFVSAKAKSLGSFGGGGGGGGGSVGSSVSGQTFSGSGISDFNPNRELFGELVVRGNDLVYVLGETRTKIAKG